MLRTGNELVVEVVEVKVSLVLEIGLELDELHATQLLGSAVLMVELEELLALQSNQPFGLEELSSLDLLQAKLLDTVLPSFLPVYVAAEAGSVSE